MSEQVSFDHSVAVSVREYSLRAWEQGQELSRLLEGLRTSSGAISSAHPSPEAGTEMIVGLASGKASWARWRMVSMSTSRICSRISQWTTKRL